MVRSLVRGMVIGAVLGLAPIASAVLIDYDCEADGDGAIVVDSKNFTGEGSTEGTLTMVSRQFRTPAHITGEFLTNDEEDPSVTLTEEVFNNTGVQWTGYQFYIYMNKWFEISEPITKPDGWTYTITQPTTGDYAFPHDMGTGWVGLVEYTKGTGMPIASGSSGNFGMKVSFEGGVLFVTEQIPVPEPISILMFTLGGLAVVARRVW